MNAAHDRAQQLQRQSRDDFATRRREDKEELVPLDVRELDALSLLSIAKREGCEQRAALAKFPSGLTKKGTWQPSWSSLNEFWMPTCARNISCVEL